MREHNARPPVLRGNIYAYVRLYAGAIERERERERERETGAPPFHYLQPRC